MAVQSFEGIEDGEYNKEEAVQYEKHGDNGTNPNILLGNSITT